MYNLEFLWELFKVSRLQESLYKELMFRYFNLHLMFYNFFTSASLIFFCRFW